MTLMEQQQAVSETIRHYQCPVKPVSLFPAHRNYQGCPFKIFFRDKNLASKEPQHVVKSKP